MVNDLTSFKPDIRKAAKSVAFQWPGVLDVDDAEQAIWERLLESPGSVQKIALMEPRARYRAIVGIGHQIANRERSSLYYFRGAYNYAVADVKALLKQGALVDPELGHRAEMLDMEDALLEMQRKVPQYVDAIWDRYAYDTVPANQTVRDALSNGLARLASEMNKVARRRYSERDDGPGTRQVMSNASARHTSDSQYDGEYEVIEEHHVWK